MSLLKSWRQLRSSFILLACWTATCTGRGRPAHVGDEECIIKKSPFPHVPKGLFNEIGPGGINRRAEEATANSRSCDICGGFHGRGILSDAPVPSFPRDEFSGDPPNEGTCTDWGNHLSMNFLSGSYDCVYFSYFLATQCCDRSNMTASYVCETKLKSKLIGEGSELEYETTVVPVPAGEDKLNVTAVLVFYHITSIDIVEGTAEIYFMIDLSWRDARLSWDPADHNGCLDIALRASLDPETTEIYVPDFDLLNRVDGVQNLPDSMAHITPDGSVHWKRMGGLKALCAFTGLEPIPFDILHCYFKFGSLYDRKVLYQFGHGDPGTPGLIYLHFPSKYQEFSLIVDKSQTYVDERGFRTLAYDFYFDRAENYYVTKIVIPTVLFTYLSFGTFLLDQRVGERLSYGVSILLVMVANSIVTSDMLPISAEVLWVDNFALASYYWVIIAVMESIVVAYLFYVDSEEEQEEIRRAAEEEKTRAEQSLKKEREKRRIENSNDEDDTYEAGSVHVTLDSETNIEVAEDFNEASSGESQKNHITKTEPSPLSQSNEQERFRKSLVREKVVTFGQILTRKKKPTERRKLQIIKNLDRTCLIVLPLTYTIYWIVMFATKNSWGRVARETLQGSMSK